MITHSICQQKNRAAHGETTRFCCKQKSPAVADKPARRCWNPGHGSLEGIKSDTIRLFACGFLLPSYRPSNFVSLNAPFSRYGGILVENRLKTYPLSFGTFLEGDPLRIFRRVIPCQKAKSWGYMKVYTSRFCFRSARHNTGCEDRQTDGRTRRWRKYRVMRIVARIKRSV